MSERSSADLISKQEAGLSSDHRSPSDPIQSPWPLTAGTRDFAMFLLFFTLIIGYVMAFGASYQFNSGILFGIGLAGAVISLATLCAYAATPLFDPFPYLVACLGASFLFTLIGIVISLVGELIDNSDAMLGAGLVMIVHGSAYIIAVTTLIGWMKSYNPVKK